MNFKIFDQFGKEGIEFAYPTQTLFLNKVKNNLETSIAVV
jgi:small-conductance mechanosensitive channel